MEFSKFMAGLNTLSPYYSDYNGFHMGAEHDQFYMYPTDAALPEEAVKKMVELGWFQPDVYLEDDAEFSPENYDPTEGWSAYV